MVRLDFMIFTCLKIFSFDLFINEVTFKAHGTSKDSWDEVDERMDEEDEM